MACVVFSIAVVLATTKLIQQVVKDEGEDTPKGMTVVQFMDSDNPDDDSPIIPGDEEENDLRRIILNLWFR